MLKLKKPNQLNVRPAGDLDYDAILAIDLDSRPGVVALDRSELELVVRAGAGIVRRVHTTCKAWTINAKWDDSSSGLRHLRPGVHISA
jgi:hypothetical protein